MKTKHTPAPHTWVEIDLSVLAENFRAVRRRLPASSKIMAVIKADAYGHGMIPTARKLLQEKVEALGVGTVEEGLQIRNHIHSTIPVIVLLGPRVEECPACLSYRLTPVIYSLPVAERLNVLAGRKKTLLPVHVKLDTGMGRLGIPWYDWPHFLEKLLGFKGLQITGLTSHFSRADEADSSYTRLQWQRYTTALKLAREGGLTLSENHMANSAAFLRDRKTHLHYIRPGILLYGSTPFSSGGMAKGFRIKPDMSFKSRILQIKRIPAGVGVSYGKTYTTRREETVAVLPVGYANGYPRLLSNQGQVLIQGRRLPVIGRVCMNLTIVRLPGELDCSLGDEVVLMGRQGRETISPEELARKARTISYEILCLLGQLNPAGILELTNKIR
jgi:alanine racemase